MNAIGPTQLNRATLQRQLLLERHDLDVSETVQRIMAIQAQEPAAPYVALWNRICDLDFAAVDAAFERREILKAPLMRITLHAVTAADYPMLHAACVPILRAARLNDRRYLGAGLVPSDADAVVDDLLAFLDVPRTKEEIVDHLASVEHGSDEARLWWALRTLAAVVHVPTGPPWSFPLLPVYEAAPTGRPRPGLDAAMDYLVRRYLSSFGPASVADIVQFSLQKTSVVRAVLERISDDVVPIAGPGGSELFDARTTPPIPPVSTHAPVRLMAMWDSTLLAYRDRSRIIPDSARPHVIRRNGDVLPTVLADGHVAGIWRFTDHGIEVSAFRPLTHDEHDELELEARALLGTIGDRRPAPFRRYDTWWLKLPADNTRLQVGG